jgi:hypothetical protein
MAPHTHIAAHKAGSNLRLRCHLALSIPDGDCAIRVGDEVRHWQESKCIVFDDTFEHEVWNRTDEDRLVLLVDLWHPDLTSLERESLEAINWLGTSRANAMLSTWQRNELQRNREGKIAATPAGELSYEQGSLTVQISSKSVASIFTAAAWPIKSNRNRTMHMP